MQVSVQTTSGLERKMTVTVPAGLIDGEIQRRMQSMARSARIDGFRPGKVPVGVIASRYGQQIRQEVVNEVTRNSLQQAISRENLRIAGMPRIESRQADAGKDLSYTVVFEVMQEFKIADLSGVAIERPRVAITDADIDGMIDTLRKQRMQWQPVERAARDGDRLTIDFLGTVADKPFPGGEGKNYPLTLGSKSFIAGFEDQLVGARVGNQVRIEVTFPQDYHAKEMAGKAAVFDVTVHDVSEGVLPAVDEAFIHGFGVADATMANFRAEVRSSMQAELDQAVRNRVKQQVLDALVSRHQGLELPQSMVNEEIGSLMVQARNMLASQGVKTDQLDIGPAMFEERAKRRVTLGLIVNEIVRQQKLKADPAKVRREVDQIAASYDDPQEVVKWHYADPSRLASVQQLVLEGDAVDWVLKQAKVDDVDMTFAEAMKEQRQLT